MSVHRLSSLAQPPVAGTIAERMERLRADANAVANEHTDALVQALQDSAALADQIAAGGDAYSIGVKEFARRAHMELASKVLSLQAIRERAH